MAYSKKTVTLRGNLSSLLREKMQTTLLPGGASFTIHKGDAYDYNILGDDLDPDDLHEEMIHLSAEIANSLRSISRSSKEAAADDYIMDTLSRMVFGSNYIEQAGCGLDITLNLCRKVFSGESVPEAIDDTDNEYVELKNDLMHKGISPTMELILRTRREVVQHGQAAAFLLTEVYLRGKDLTEAMILQAHRLLTFGIDTDQGYSWTQYSGVYRQVPVCAGLTSFPDPEQVPHLMRQMIHNLNQDIEAAVRAGTVDPVELASKYCHQFVNIHPFIDGNGRTCRLILNALLLKYGSFPACIGQDDESRDRYLEIAANASMNELSHQGDFDADDAEAPKYYKQLANFTLKYATEAMRGFVHALKGDRSAAI